MTLGANMAMLLKSMLHRGKCCILGFNMNGHCAARPFCVKTPDEPTSDASEQDYRKPAPTHDVEQRRIDRIEAEKKRREAYLKAKPYSAIPEMPSIPIFGSAWNYFPIIGEYNSRRMYEADFKKQKIYGDILKERFGEFELVNCYHPQANTALVKSQGMYPERAEFATLKRYREKRRHIYGKLGLVAMQGEEWANFRTEVTHSMISLNKDAIVSIARDFVALIRAKRDASNEIPDLMDLLHKWALESISCLTMDARLDCLNPDMESTSDGAKLIKSVHIQLECINKMEASSGNFPFWKYMPSPTWRKFEKAADVFTDLVHKYITVTTNQFKLRKGKGVTILGNMLFDQKMPQSSVTAAVAEMIMAGIDTTAHSAGYFLYNLGKNPDKQELLYEELLKGDPDKESTLGNKYLHKCMFESMRLLPAVRGHMRILKRDTVLLGYRIPTGTPVLSVQEVFTRDERFYTNADKFIPERQAIDEIYHLEFPFGLGKRSCVGKRIATLEILELISEVLRAFRLEYNHEDIKLVTRLINIPDRPIRMKFHDRQVM